MRRKRNYLISHVSAIVLFICHYAAVLESKSMNSDANTIGVRAALLAAADAYLSNNTDGYDNFHGGGNSLQNGTGITRGPPVLTQSNSQVIEVPARENVELKCPVTSEPPPLYDWFKGQDRIDSSWERFELPSSRGSNLISIRSVKHEDEGEYTCEGVNGFGKVSFTIRLVVTGEDPFKDNYLKSVPPNRRNGVNNSNNNNSSSSTTERPEILKDQLPREKSISFAKGNNSTLKCEASGNPRPNITWFKDNIQLGSAKQDVSHLKLINISESDAGVYKCEATNSYGKSIFEIIIEVEVGSWQERAKAEIVQLAPYNLTLFPGENGSITCLARLENEFQPHIFWVKQVGSLDNSGMRTFKYNGSYFVVLNGTDIKENSRHLFETDLLLMNVSRADAGNYHCVVAGRMGYIHSEAHVFVQTDPVHLLNIQLSKERAVTIQWAVFSCFVFLITTVLILACIYKMYSCHRQVKPNFTITKNSHNRAFPPVSFFRCNNSISINTHHGDKSGGDTTVSTTLSNPNPSQENIQPLVTAASGSISCSSSPALSASSSVKFQYEQRRRHHKHRHADPASHRSREHRHRHHHVIVKPPSFEPCDGGLGGDFSAFSDANDSSPELQKLYTSSVNQICGNCDDCSDPDGPPTPVLEHVDFDHQKDSHSACLNCSRHSSQNCFRHGVGPNKEGSVSSGGSWSYASINLQTENLNNNNNNNNNDLLDNSALMKQFSRNNGTKSDEGPNYQHHPNSNTLVVQYSDPEVFHDKNLNSCYYLNKNMNEFPEYFKGGGVVGAGEKLNKRKRRAQQQTHHTSRYHQPPSSPVSFYSNALIIV